MKKKIISFSIALLFLVLLIGRGITMINQNILMINDKIINLEDKSKVITAEQTTFFKTGKNLFDKSKNTNVGNVLDGLSGELIYFPIGQISEYIPIKENTYYTISKGLGSAGIGHCFYDENKNFISGVISKTINSQTILSPLKSQYIRLSNVESLLDIQQIEENNKVTEYEPYKLAIGKEDLDLPQNNIVGDSNKKYRFMGANIRTPINLGGNFAIHDDIDHEPMGISSVYIVDGTLRVDMNFMSKKVITLTATPHVSMMNDGYEIATTGGLQTHAIYFYKNGMQVNAEDVFLDGGSFWISGMFLVD